MKTPEVMYHTRHACGHSVYWSNPSFAIGAAMWPCPWCGAENGEKVPPENPTTYDPDVELWCVRELLPDGSMPLVEAGKELSSKTIIVQHMTSEVCCSPRIRPAPEPQATWSRKSAADYALAAREAWLNGREEEAMHLTLLARRAASEAHPELWREMMKRQRRPRRKR